MGLGEDHSGAGRHVLTPGSGPHCRLHHGRPRTAAGDHRLEPRCQPQSDPEETGYRIYLPADRLGRCGARGVRADASLEPRSYPARSSLAKPTRVEGEGREDGPAGSRGPSLDRPQRR